MQLLILIASSLMATVGHPRNQSTIILPKRLISVEAPDVAVGRTSEAEALALAALIHDRGIRTLEYQSRLTNPEVPSNKGMNQLRHVREDDLGRHWIRRDLQEQWTNGIDPKSRKPAGMDLTQIHNNGQWVASLSEIDKVGGFWPANDENSFAGGMRSIMGREIEHNKYSRPLGEILLSSPTLIISRQPDTYGVATLRASLVLDGHHTTLEADIATRQDFVCVGIRRYDAAFNALKWSVECTQITNVDGTWIPSLAMESTNYAITLSQSEQQPYVKALTEAGIKSDMNFLLPQVQSSLRAGYTKAFGSPHYPVGPLLPEGPVQMTMVGEPIVNRRFSPTDFRVVFPESVRWLNTFTGEDTTIDLTKSPEDQP